MSDILRNTIIYKSNLLKCKEPVSPKVESVPFGSPEFYWLIAEMFKEPKTK